MTLPHILMFTGAAVIAALYLESSWINRPATAESQKDAPDGMPGKTVAYPRMVRSFLIPAVPTPS